MNMNARQYKSFLSYELLYLDVFIELKYGVEITTYLLYKISICMKVLLERN